MPKQNKRDKYVVVNEIYFNLIEKKAAMLDEITSDPNGDLGGVYVRIEDIKGIEKIYKEWIKQDADDLAGQEPYTAPKD